MRAQIGESQTDSESESEIVVGNEIKRIGSNGSDQQGDLD
jgi:hypothetical protein